MGNASNSSDPFGRTKAPAAGPHVLAPDRFKEKAEKDAARRGKPRGDAFAGKATARASPFDPKPRAAAMRPAQPQPVQRTLKNGAALRVVASKPVPVQRIERDELRRAKPAAKASSLVLVSSGSVMTAAAEQPAVAGGAGGPGELAMPKVDKAAPKRAARSGGGGGGGGSGGAGGGATPWRDRVFNQDDLVGVLIVTAMLLLLILYLMRGSGGQVAATDDRILNTQFAATEPAAPPAPLADPFGDAPVDLTPKSPLPPTPEAVIAAAPAPASVAEPALANITMHAWFCTAKSELTPSTMAALDRQLVSWKSHLTTRELVVVGYADTRGASDYNVSLGGARASVVADYLKAKGVKVATASGVGELPGLADNENCANQRRVDVRLLAAADEPSKSCAPPQDFAELVCS